MELFLDTIHTIMYITGALFWITLIILGGMAAFATELDKHVEKPAYSELTAEQAFDNVWNHSPEDIAPAWLRAASSLAAFGNAKQAERAWWYYERHTDTPKEAA